MVRRLLYIIAIMLHNAAIRRARASHTTCTEAGCQRVQLSVPALVPDLFGTTVADLAANLHLTLPIMCPHSLRIPAALGESVAVQ